MFKEWLSMIADIITITTKLAAITAMLAPTALLVRKVVMRLSKTIPAANQSIESNDERLWRFKGHLGRFWLLYLGILLNFTILLYMTRESAQPTIRSVLFIAFASAALCCNVLAVMVGIYVERFADVMNVLVSKIAKREETRLGGESGTS